MSERDRIAAVLVEFVACGSGFEYDAADALIAAGCRMPTPVERREDLW